MSTGASRAQGTDSLPEADTHHPPLHTGHRGPRGPARAAGRQPGAAGEAAAASGAGQALGLEQGPHVPTEGPSPGLPPQPPPTHRKAPPQGCGRRRKGLSEDRHGKPRRPHIPIESTPQGPLMAGATDPHSAAHLAKRPPTTQFTRVTGGFPHAAPSSLFLPAAQTRAPGPPGSAGCGPQHSLTGRPGHTRRCKAGAWPSPRRRDQPGRQEPQPCPRPSMAAVGGKSCLCPGQGVSRWPAELRAGLPYCARGRGRPCRPTACMSSRASLSNTYVTPTM